MNSEQQLRDVYRQTVLDHSRNPRNFRRIEAADRRVEGNNPLCGDKIMIYLRLNEGKIQELAFEGTGCAISMASASIMTEALTGQTLSEAQVEVDQVLQGFQTGDGGPDVISGRMAALGGVKKFPSRVKCAILAWKTLAAGLRNEDTTVTTED